MPLDILTHSHSAEADATEQQLRKSQARLAHSESLRTQIDRLLAHLTALQTRIGAWKDQPVLREEAINLQLVREIQDQIEIKKKENALAGMQQDFSALETILYFFK